MMDARKESCAITLHCAQCFIQRMRNLGFPTLKLKFPPSSFADFCHILGCITFPSLSPYLLNNLCDMLITTEILFFGTVFNFLMLMHVLGVALRLSRPSNIKVLVLCVIEYYDYSHNTISKVTHYSWNLLLLL